MQRSRVIDFVLYFAISGAIVMCLLAAAFLGINQVTFLNGSAYFLTALGVLGSLISDSRSLLKQKNFWLFTSVIFIVHSVGFLIIVRQTGVLKPAWFLIFLESVAVRSIRNVFFRRDHHP